MLVISGPSMPNTCNASCSDMGLPKGVLGKRLRRKMWTGFVVAGAEKAIPLREAIARAGNRRYCEYASKVALATRADTAVPIPMSIGRTMQEVV